MINKNIESNNVTQRINDQDYYQQLFLTRLSNNSLISQAYPFLCSNRTITKERLFFQNTILQLVKNIIKMIKSNEVIPLNTYLKIAHTSHMGRGIFARIDIPINTEILTIHKNRYISYVQLSEHKYLSKICGQTPSKLAEFAFFLAFISKISYSKPQYTSLKQYIQQLPSYYNNLICWQQQELKKLNNPILIDKIIKKKEWLRQIYQQLFNFRYKDQKQPERQAAEIVEDRPSRGNRKRKRQSNILHKPQLKQQFQEMHIIKQISFVDFIKAYAGIQSRNSYFENHFDNKSQVGALVQHLENFNHSKNPQCIVERCSSSYRVTTIKQVVKGEQLFVNYGSNFSIEQFLELYGMIPEDNEYDPGCYTQKQNQTQNSSQFFNSLSLKSMLGFGAILGGKSISQQRQYLAIRYNQLMNKSKSLQKQSIIFGVNPLSEKN